MTKTKELIGEGFIVALRTLHSAADAFPPLKSAAGALAIIDLIKQFKTSKRAWSDSAIRISKDILDIQQNLQKYEDVPSDLRQSLQCLLDALNEVRDALTRIQNESTFQRVVTARDDSARIQIYSNQINRAVEKFKFDCQVAERMAIQRVEQFAKITALLPFAKAGYNSCSREGATKCFEGTRGTILQHIQEWFDRVDPGAPQILWLNGLAGTGKTTIAHTIAEDYDSQKKLGASFFFSRDVSERSDALLVFTSIAHQLANFDQHYRSQVVQILDEDVHVGSKMIHYQFRHLIARPLRQMPQTRSPILVVIDALDECTDEKKLAEILRVLVAEIHTVPLLKLLITSRPERYIRAPLERQGFIAPSVVLHDMDKSIVQSDIRRFLRSRLEDIPATLRPWPSDDDLDILVDKSSGLFVFASTVVKFIEANDYADPQRLLDIVLRSQSAVGISPYRDLDILYLQVLANPLRVATNAELYGFLQFTLGCIVLLRNPLPPGPLERLLCMKAGSLPRSLSRVSSVIVVPNTDARNVRIIHPSFHDFLTSSNPRRCYDPRFFVDVSAHHGLLALLCFKQMKRYLKRDICAIGDFSKLNSELGDEELRRIEVNIPPELRYACSHWTWHLSLSSMQEQHVLSLESFAFTQLLYWLEALSLIGLFDLALSCVKAARSWLEGNVQASQRLKEILYDAERFVQAYHDPIAASALQIYYSALPFAPRRTAFFSTYSAELHSSLKVLYGEVETWSSCLRTIDVGYSVRSVAFSGDGTRIVSGSNGGPVIVWDSVLGTELLKLDADHGSPDTDSVHSVAFSANDTRIVSATRSGSVAVWDAESGLRLFASKGGIFNSFEKAAISSDGAYCISGGYDGTIIVWDSATGEVLLTLEGHSKEISSLASSPDGTLIASGSRDETARLWASSSGALLHTLEHSAIVTLLAFSRDGTMILSGDSYGNVRTWDVRSVDHEVKCRHIQPTGWVACSADFTRLVTARDSQLKIWDSQSPTSPLLLMGNSDSVRSVAISSDGTRVATGSDDETANI